MANLLEEIERIVRKVFAERPPPDEYNDPANQTVYEAGPDEPYTQGLDPIPVAIANPDDFGVLRVVAIRGTLGFTSQHHVCTPTSGPVQLAGKNTRRRSVVIVNKGPSTVAVGSDNNVRCAGVGNPNGNGEIYANDSLSMDTTDEVWAVLTPAGVTTDVMVYQTLDEGSPS